jgi:hypothetical protein
VLEAVALGFIDDATFLPTYRSSRAIELATSRKPQIIHRGLLKLTYYIPAATSQSFEIGEID